MTHFRVTVDVTCPSNWGKEDVRRWVGKILCPDEVKTVEVVSLDESNEPAERA